MIEFLLDAQTGFLYAYKDGVLVGPVNAMGEEAPARPSTDLWREAHYNG